MGSDLPSPPLIVTAELDPGAQALFEDLRRRHFPPGRTQVGAHLTLFHHLPGDEEAQVLEDLRLRTAGRPPIPAVVDRLLPLGRGVAYHVEAPALLATRRLLAERWDAWLTRQDRAWARPHVTVQNKVEPAEAAALLEHLQASFAPFAVRVEALRLWRYLGGPWEAVARLPLNGKA